MKFPMTSHNAEPSRQSFPVSISSALPSIDPRPSIDSRPIGSLIPDEEDDVAPWKLDDDESHDLEPQVSDTGGGRIAARTAQITEGARRIAAGSGGGDEQSGEVLRKKLISVDAREGAFPPRRRLGAGDLRAGAFSRRKRWKERLVRKLGPGKNNLREYLRAEGSLRSENLTTRYLMESLHHVFLDYHNQSHQQTEDMHIRCKGGECPDFQQCSGNFTAVDACHCPDMEDLSRRAALPPLNCPRKKKVMVDSPLNIKPVKILFDPKCSHAEDDIPHFAWVSQMFNLRHVYFNSRGQAFNDSFLYDRNGCGSEHKMFNLCHVYFNSRGQAFNDSFLYDRNGCGSKHTVRGGEVVGHTVRGGEVVEHKVRGGEVVEHTVRGGEVVGHKVRGGEVVEHTFDIPEGTRVTVYDRIINLAHWNAYQFYHGILELVPVFFMLSKAPHLLRALPIAVQYLQMDFLEKLGTFFIGMEMVHMDLRVVPDNEPIAVQYLQMDFLEKLGTFFIGMDIIHMDLRVVPDDELFFARQVLQMDFLEKLGTLFIGMDMVQMDLRVVPDDEVFFAHQVLQPYYQWCGRPSRSLWRHFRRLYLLPPDGLPMFLPDWTPRINKAMQSYSIGFPGLPRSACGLGGGAVLAQRYNTQALEKHGEVEELLCAPADWVVVLAQRYNTRALEQHGEVEELLCTLFPRERVVVFDGSLRIADGERGKGRESCSPVIMILCIADGEQEKRGPDRVGGIRGGSSTPSAVCRHARSSAHQRHLHATPPHPIIPNLGRSSQISLTLQPRLCSVKLFSSWQHTGQRSPTPSSCRSSQPPPISPTRLSSYPAAKALFNRAVLFVAAHGAAITNAIFMPFKSVLLELRPRDFHKACYHHLAEVCDLQYLLLLCEGAKDTPLSCDMGEVRRVLEEVQGRVDKVLEEGPEVQLEEEEEEEGQR
ncbi:unnamed protein product [Closterium sp. NIES-64]|nr:unnamed protein product [Closterium sp. NIES-64]